MENVAGLLAAVVAAFGPLAAGVTKLVDAARGLFDRNDNAPGWTWIVLAFVISLAVCLGFELNVTGALVSQIPALADSSALEGVAGQVVTALGMAGSASYWHHRMAKAKAESGPA